MKYTDLHFQNKLWFRAHLLFSTHSMLKSTICGTIGSFSCALGHSRCFTEKDWFPYLQIRSVYCSRFVTMNVTKNEYTMFDIGSWHIKEKNM